MTAVTRTMMLETALCLSKEEEDDDNKDKDYDARDGSFPV